MKVHIFTSVCPNIKHQVGLVFPSPCSRIERCFSTFLTNENLWQPFNAWLQFTPHQCDPLLRFRADAQLLRAEQTPSRGWRMPFGFNDHFCTQPCTGDTFINSVIMASYRLGGGGGSTANFTCTVFDLFTCLFVYFIFPFFKGRLKSIVR